MEEIEKKIYPFMIGVFSISFQVILLREILSFFDFIELSGLFFSFWFLWGFIGVRRGERIKLEKGNLTGYFFLAYFSFAFSLVFIRFYRNIFSLGSFESITLKHAILLSLISTFLPSFYSGSLFSITVNALNTTIKEVYKKEIAGSLFSGIFIYYGLTGKFTNWEIAGILGFFLIAVVILFLERSFKRFFILLLIVPIFTLILFDKITFQKKLFPEYKTVYRFETEEGNFFTLKKDNQYYFYKNNKLLFSLPYYHSKEKEVGIPILLSGKNKGEVLLFSKNPKTVDEVLKTGNFMITYYFGRESFCKKLFLRFYQIKNYLLEKKINLKCSNSFEELLKNKKYDLILLISIHPDIEYENHFITLDFLKRLNFSLKPHGLLLITVPFSSNFYDKYELEALSSIITTLKKVFSSVYYNFGDEFVFFISSKQSFKPDFKKTYNELSYNPNFLSLSKKDIELVENSFKKILYKKEISSNSKLNTFYKPFAFFYLKTKRYYKYRVEKIFSFFNTTYGKIALWLLVPIFYFMFIIKSIRYYILIFLVSAFSIFSDVYLIFTFQERFGYAYRFLILIIVAFFFGLSTGTVLEKIVKKARFTVSFTLFLVSSILFFPSYFLNLKNVYILFSFFAGFLNSFVFLKSIKNIVPPDGEKSYPYAIDLFGAFLGAFLFSIIAFFPMPQYYPLLFILPVFIFLK